VIWRPRDEAWRRTKTRPRQPFADARSGLDQPQPPVFRLPVFRLPVSSLPVSSVPVSSVPVSSVPVSSVPVIYGQAVANDSGPAPSTGKLFPRVSVLPSQRKTSILRSCMLCTRTVLPSRENAAASAQPPVET
jgi:hypothetical protein